jgi:tetratricopeptide (TPR) repeat protein
MSKLIVLYMNLVILFAVFIYILCLTKPVYALTNQTNVTTLIEKGNNLLSSNHYEEAITYYDKALSINPKDTATLDNEANALFHLNRYNEAITYYDKALSINPKDTAALNYKGSALVKIDKYDEAIASLDKSLSINPWDTVALQVKTIALLQKFLTILIAIIVFAVTFFLTKRKGVKIALINAVIVATIVIVLSFILSTLKMALH